MKEYTNDLISQPIEFQILCGYWLCLYINNLKFAKTLVDEYDILSKYKETFINEKNTKNMSDNLKLFGRKFNNIFFKIAIRIKEEKLAM
jgi:hypothetical protein